jgi:hypothetical protein
MLALVVATIALSIPVSTVRIAAVGVRIIVSVRTILAVPVVVSCGLGSIQEQQATGDKR